MKIVKFVIGMLQRALGKSRILRGFFVRLRNQVSAVIQHGLSDGIEMDRNGEAWLIDLIARDSIFFVDVGANKGLWSQRYLDASKDAVRGLAFEPSREAAEVLRDMVDRRFPGRVEIVEAAVSDARGCSTFYAEPGCGETSSLLPTFSLQSAVARRVEVTTIDTEIETRSLGHVDMLKIDTEGYDLHVLRGARTSLRNKVFDVVQFEYNAPWAYANSTLHEAIELLTDCGYRLLLLRSGRLERFDYETYGEYYRYSNFVALSPRGCLRLARVLP